MVSKNSACIVHIYVIMAVCSNFSKCIHYIYNLYHKYLEVCRYIRQKCIIYTKSVHTPILSIYTINEFF